MKTSSFLVPFISLLAGLVGGLASRFVPGPAVSQGSYGTVRAHRLELIDASGKTKAFLGTTADGPQHTALVFLDGNQRQRAELGVSAGTATPYLVLRGQEGAERFRLDLPYRTERPVIMLRDERKERVRLGFFPTDYESPEDRQWGLSFYNADSPYRTLSGIGMGPKTRKTPLSDMHPKLPTEMMQGYIAVRDEAGHEWTPPKE